MEANEARSTTLREYFKQTYNTECVNNIENVHNIRLRGVFTTENITNIDK